MTDEDITYWVDRLKASDPRAAQRIWEAYFEKLTRLARRRMEARPRRIADEEDVALSAFNSMYRRAREGRFPQLDDRHDLWKLLVTIALRKITAQRRREFAQKRGGGNVRGESIFRKHDDRAQDGLNQLAGIEPTPETAAIVTEDCDRLIDALGDERLVRIAQDKLEGYSNDEIAKRLNCTTRTVERKLARIRDIWSELGTDDKE